ncbi:MAG TPA: ATP-binding protein [Polyangiaceae bacterium]|nr:ATP-binding protein [Polyangiaceae bacterium]
MADEGGELRPERSGAEAATSAVRHRGRLPLGVWLWPLLVLGCGLAISYAMAVVDHRDQVQRARDDASVTLGTVRDALSRETFGAIYLTEGIAATVAIEGGISQEKFEALSAELLERNDIVRNVALAPDNVVLRVFPRDGNEKAIGLDYAKNPTQWPSVASMMEQRGHVVAGPLTLVQGGVGLIGRSPIYVRDDARPGSHRYWGLISTVLDFERLLGRTPIEAASDDLRIALRGIDGTGVRGGPIWGDRVVFDSSPVVMEVPLPSGSWSLAAVPRRGWPLFRPFSSIYAVTSASLSVVLSLFSFQVLRLASKHRRARAAVVEREQQLSMIYDTVADAIFHVAIEPGDRYRIVSVNRAFTRLTGLEPEAVIDEDIAVFVPPESLPQVKLRYRAAREREEVVRWEAIEEYPAGRIAGELSVAPGLDAEGRCTYLVGTIHDVTERKRAAEALARSEERYRTTLESIMEGCQILDFEWRYTYLNDVAARHNRRPNAELLGRRMQAAWPGIEDTPVFAMLKRSLEERVALHEEVEFRFPDGSSGWFDVRSQPVPEGIFVLSIDIGKRKRAETALRELNESLERKVRERTLDLETAKKRAEAADHLKSAFLATMSHELRTPLNSIIGFTGIISQGLAGPLTDEQAKQLGMVMNSARHLLDLINDVLDISKIEAGQLEVRPAAFDLRASIDRVTTMVAPLAAQKGLRLKVLVPDTLGSMHSDRRRVEQILLNLLNNAVKFTDSGEVSLSVELENGDARIRVADTGIGMQREHLSELFQPFRQLDTGLQRQHEGTGLGLAICQRLTALLGGAIAVESEWGRGSVFSVTLPTALHSS